MYELFDILKVIFLGIVEGVTEWLPVSSTGHMILFEDYLSLGVSEDFLSMFLVVIQLGAILAVPVLFFDKLCPFGKNKTKEDSMKIWQLWLKVIIGIIPVGIIGFLFDDMIDDFFLSGDVKSIVVAIALVVWGVAFILVEHFKKKEGKEPRVDSVYDLTYRDALFIGSFQIFSLIPGTSRSGSTILGGLLFNVSRTCASEFSFFMAIPVMLGASLLKVLKFIIKGIAATPFEIILLFIGIVVSFLVSLLAIRFLMNFVKKNSFTVFGIYRIVLGVIVILNFLITTLNV